VYTPSHILTGFILVTIILPYLSVLNDMNRYFGGIKLGTGGLVRAYGGVASECLKDAPTCLVKPKVIDV
jgi:putative IMPACT (imprinted ancient) family translation regulator